MENTLIKKAEVEVQQHKFNALVLISKKFTAENRYYEACIVAEIAAYFAATNHPGIFSSPLLEKVLLEIGNKCIKRHNRRKLENTVSLPKRILHVLTEAHSIGGHTRGVWRWIQLDSSRSHSIAITQQKKNIVPSELKQAAIQSGGAFHILDNVEADLLKIAQLLWEISYDIDLVILHTHSRDIIPILAFSDTEMSPRVAKLDIADHVFWLGASICNSIFHMRDVAFALAEKRRAIPPIQSVLLPIPLATIEGNLSKDQAKEEIGFCSEDIILLSIASGYKYLTISSSFLDIIEPIILRYPQVKLIAIGPTKSSEWAKSFDRTGGRIHALGPRSDTDLFYQAADIYLDSFPFASNTSILEAGLYGLPAISYSPYQNDDRVLSAGCPGFAKALLMPRDIKTYQRVIEHLIKNKKLRQRIGQSTKRSIELFHTGKGWLSILDAAYSHAFKTPRSSLRLNEIKENISNIIDNLDIAINFLLKNACQINLQMITELSSIRSIGIIPRFSIINELRTAVEQVSLSIILPQKLENIISRIWHNIRKLYVPIIKKTT